MMKWILIAISTIWLCGSTSGQATLEVTPAVRSAYDAISSLRMDDAQVLIAYIKRHDPDNFMVLHLEHYVDFFTIFITEDDQRFKQIEDRLDHRIDLLERVSNDNPYKLFCEAEMELMWSLIRLKWDQKLRAGTGILRAYRLLQRNIDLHPSLQENKKSLSIINAVSESLPSILRTLIGIRGSIEAGTADILSFVETARTENSMWYREGVVIATYMLFYLNNEQDAAWQLLDEHNLDVARHPLLTFIYSNMAQKTGQNDKAIAMLKDRVRGDQQLDFRYLDLLYGKFKLYRLDADADKYLKKYIEGFGGRHFIKEGYQKLAWYALVVDRDPVAYRSYMDQCLLRGELLTDEDKQAHREAASGILPDAALLRIRLLYDGGYLDRARSELALIEGDYTKDNTNRESYIYRWGRVLQDLGHTDQALIKYRSLLAEFSASDSYYHCNAALQAGLLLEEKGEYTSAITMLYRCLDIDATSYKSSLHQKAKAAIERVRSKEIR